MPDESHPTASGEAEKPARSRRRFLLRLLRVAVCVLVLLGVGVWLMVGYLQKTEPMPNLPEWITTVPIAHRGMHDEFRGIPENSRPAFQRAIDHGFAIELDIHVLADGRIAVFHDFNLKRMTGVDKRIEDCTTEELGELVLRDSEERIPMFTEVLDLVHGQVPLLIELKNDSRKNRALERAAGPIIAKYAGPCAVQSFNAFSLKWFRKHHPQIPRGQLSCDFDREDTDLDYPYYKKLAVRHLLLNHYGRPHFVSYDHRCLPAWAVDKQRDSGVPVLAWTVRNEEEQRSAVPQSDNFIFEGYVPKR